MRLCHVEQRCGGQGGESLQRLVDERQIGVELGGTSSALTVAVHSRLAQYPLDGVVVDTELGGDGAHSPVLDEVVAQDLRHEFVADRHRAVRSAPCGGSKSPANRRAPPVDTHEFADRACTEVAPSHGGWVGGHRRARLAPENSLAHEWSTASGRCGTLMLHDFPASLE